MNDEFPSSNVLYHCLATLSSKAVGDEGDINKKLLRCSRGFAELVDAGEIFKN
jgi:hypothetical protein